MNSRGIRAGRAFVELGTDNNKLEKGLRRAQARVNAFANNIAMVGTKMLAIGTSIVAPLLLAGRAFAKTGDDLSKMSQRTGVAVETLSRLEFASQRSGASIEAVQKSLFRMQRTIGDASRGMRTATNALDELGLSTAELLMMSPEEQFLAVVEALSKVESASVQASLGQAVLGRGFRDVLPLLQEGAKGMRTLFEESDRLGNTWSTGMANDAKNLTDRLYDMRAGLGSIVREIGSAVSPQMQRLSVLLANTTIQVREFITSNKEMVVLLFQAGLALTAIGATLLVFAAAVKIAAAALGVMATVAKVAGLALVALKSSLMLIASPIVLVAGLFALIGAAALQATVGAGQAFQWLGDRLKVLAGTAREVFGGIQDALAAGNFILAVQVLWEGIRMEFTRGLNWLKGVWRDAAGIIGDAFTAVRTSVSTTFIDLFSMILNAWPGVVEGIVSIFMKAIHTMQDAWYGFKGLIDDAAAIIVTIGNSKVRDQLILENINQRDQDARNRMGARQQQIEEIQATLQLIREDPEGVNRGIRNRAEESSRQRQANAEAAAEADRDRLAAAQERFLAAREAARAARAESEVALTVPDIDTPSLRVELPDLVDLGETVRRQTDIAGSFSAAAFDRLGVGGTSAEDQIARNTAAMERLMERQNRLLENGLGLEFE